MPYKLFNLFVFLSVFLILAKIGIFYTAFYGVLAALVAICIWAFFQTLDPRIPKWTLDGSLIGTNPGILITSQKMSKKILSISFCCCFLKGLGFRPLPEMDNVESTLIWYKGTHHENYKQWTDSLDEFLAGKLS